jgi:hypothetical protein
VASWGGALQFVTLGPWRDEHRADRATAILSRRTGFYSLPGVEARFPRFVRARDRLQQQRAAATADGAEPPPHYGPPVFDELASLNSMIATLPNSLVTEERARVDTFAGLTIERNACRLPDLGTDDPAQMRFDPPVSVVSVSGPCWIPVVLFGALPALALARVIVRLDVRHRRILEQRCPECGYDLRASPERCPECGHTPRVASGSGHAAADALPFPSASSGQAGRG